MDNKYKDIVLYDLQDCPFCGGPGVMDHVGDWCVYIECVDCGARTGHMEYKDEKTKKEAELASVELWNNGRVANSFSTALSATLLKPSTAPSSIFL